MNSVTAMTPFAISVTLLIGKKPTNVGLVNNVNKKTHCDPGLGMKAVRYAVFSGVLGLCKDEKSEPNPAWPIMS